MGNELQVMRLNIAICDDEKAIREQINELIEKEKAGMCINPNNEAGGKRHIK